MAILVINAFSSIISVMLLMTGLRKSKCSTGFYLYFLLITLLVDVLLSSSGNNYLFLRIIIEVSILNCIDNDIVEATFSIVSAETILLCIVFLVGPLTYLFPEMNMVLYNLSMSAFVIITSMGIGAVLHRKYDYIKIIPKKLKWIIILVEISTVVPVTFSYKIFNKQQLILVTSFLLFYTILLIFMIIQIIKTLLKNQELEFKRGQNKIQKKIINRNMQKITTFIMPVLLLKKAIMEEDFDKVKKIYLQYIQPHYRTISDAEEVTLNRVKMQTIKFCLIDALMRSEKIDLIVNGNISIPESIILEADLYVILDEFLCNAITHTDNRSCAVIHVILFQNEVGGGIEIANTYYRDRTKFYVNQLFMDQQSNPNGFGLKYARYLLDRSELTYHTFLRGDMFVQNIEYEME